MALRQVDLEQICSQFSELTDPPSTEAIKLVLSEAIKVEYCSKDPSSCLIDQHHSGKMNSHVHALLEC